MLDISLGEMTLIAVVALVVIGPEQLPKAAKRAGLVCGYLQKFVRSLKETITEELALEEMTSLQNEAQKLSETLQNSVQEELIKVKNEVKSTTETAFRSDTIQSLMENKP
ncbi:MAG: Sec-independent protein translocase protein TatB [Legionellales bacterium]|nr:Sec-independent protein translocase protein TatB [Legionellales bacterium]